LAIFYNPRTITDGLVLALDAGNIKSYNAGISTTTWTDLSGIGNTGTLTNGPTYSSANGGSIVFDGVDDYVQVTNSNGFGEVNTTPTMTLELWANINRKSGGGAQYQHLAGFRTSNFAFYFLLLDESGASVNTEARISTTSSISNITVNYINYFDKWTHIVFVANDTRSDLYFNGTLIGSNTGVTGSFGGSSGNFRIGLDPNGSYSTKGNISSAKVYNRALSAAEVSQNFNALRGRYGI
jgi:hypothetical protein